jgi:hypothetical protein
MKPKHKHENETWYNKHDDTADPPPLSEAEKDWAEWQMECKHGTDGALRDYSICSACVWERESLKNPISCVITLSNAGYTKLQELLEKPQVPSEKLRELMQDISPDDTVEELKRALKLACDAGKKSHDLYEDAVHERDILRDRLVACIVLPINSQGEFRCEWCSSRWTTAPADAEWHHEGCEAIELLGRPRGVGG